MLRRDSSKACHCQRPPHPRATSHHHSVTTTSRALRAQITARNEGCVITATEQGEETYHASAGGHDGLVGLVSINRLEGEVLHGLGVVPHPTAPGRDVVDGVALLLHLAGEIHLDERHWEHHQRHNGEGVDHREKEEQVAQDVHEDIETGDALGHGLVLGRLAKEICDVGLDERMREVEHKRDKEVLLGHLPQMGNRVAPELAGEDRHLGHVLDGPAILASSQLAGAKAGGLTLLCNNAAGGNAELPHTVAAAAHEHLQGRGGGGLLLVEEDLLSRHEEDVRGDVILVHLEL